jgi:acyl-CoA thioester hydrolase
MTRPRTSRADYALIESFTTRWRDNDVYAHMNNAVYYEYVDSVVNGWLIRTGALDLPDGPVIGLVVETGCVFHASLGFPGRVEAGLRVRRIGTSSVTYGIGLFAEGADLAAAEAHFTHVCVDRASRRPVPLPPALRDALEGLRVG